MEALSDAIDQALVGPNPMPNVQSPEDDKISTTQQVLSTTNVPVISRSTLSFVECTKPVLFAYLVVPQPEPYDAYRDSIQSTFTPSHCEVRFDRELWVLCRGVVSSYRVYG